MLRRSKQSHNGGLTLERPIVVAVSLTRLNVLAVRVWCPKLSHFLESRWSFVHGRSLETLVLMSAKEQQQQGKGR